MTTALLAHGIGGRQDLPLPFEWAVAGAAAAVVVSFVALGVLWKDPRIAGPGAGRPLPTGLARFLDGTAFRAGVGVLAALLGIYALVSLTGADNASNPMPWLVYVYLWVGLVPASVLLGAVWAQLNPLRRFQWALSRALRLDASEGLYPLPRAIGHWPAAIGLFGFTWLELVYPDNAELSTFRWVIGVYCAVHFFASVLYGSHWFDRADAFETWSGLFGRLSTLGRRDDGVLVLRSPLAGLDALPPAPGLVATVMVMLGSTAYDGLTGNTGWIGFVQTSEVFGTPVPTLLLPTLGLLGCILLLSALFVACTWAAGRLAGVPRGTHGESMPAAFAHSVVPVALGYVVAHYYTLLVLEGQRGLAHLGDPRGTGADPFGLADLTANPGLVEPTLVSCVQVLSIVTGHVIGVVLAHDRAVRLFPRRAAVLGQVPLLVLMVGLTCTGLILLFAA